MSHKNILIANEKCMDCLNYVKAGFFRRFYVCRFGLVPFFMKSDDPNRASVVCQKYLDLPEGKDAPAMKAFKKLQRKRK